MQLAEQLVGEARERRRARMHVRERTVEQVSAFLVVCAAIAIATLLPWERAVDIPVAAALVVGYAVVWQVRFEIGDYAVHVVQLVIIPMLVLLPLPLVPLLILCASALAATPDLLTGRWHPERWVSPISDCWFAIPPVLVLASLAPTPPTIDSAAAYGLALLAQFGGDLAWGSIRDRLVNPVPIRESLRASLETARVDAVLSPIAFVVALVAMDHPVVLAGMAPLVWLLLFFSQDRQERYTATLELNRAYRGTVLLLADVVEFDDRYTADHSRSVVEFVHAVADELGIDRRSRQELEFAALLHDVGKISIPKEILNKPAKLTDDEFELMKTHTIEGQFMLDRIGGLLGRVGEIVRSCHERWDGLGYPDGLRGEEIPLEARIAFACDAYNAMTTDRPYRAALPKEVALAELRENTGTQFDPTVVEALVRVVERGDPEPRSVDEVRALLARVRVPQKASVA